MEQSHQERLTYCELHAAVDVQFWQELRNKKVKEWKLAEPVVEIAGFLQGSLSSRTVATTSTAVFLRRESFVGSAGDSCVSPGSTFFTATVPGLLKNFGAEAGLESRSAKRFIFSVFIKQVVAPLFFSLTASPEEEEKRWSTTNYAQLAVLTFVDAKHYRFHHRVGFPTASVDSPIFVRQSCLGWGPLVPFTESVASSIHAHCLALVRETAAHGCCPFFAVLDGPTVSFVSFSPHQYTRLTAQGAAFVLCAFDVSAVDHSLSWSLRTVLVCLRLAVPSLSELRIYAVRPGGLDRCLFVECSCAALNSSAVEPAMAKAKTTFTSAENVEDVDWAAELPFLKVIGWQRRNPDMVDLSTMLDPALRADTDTTLNLELMRWRVLPSLELAGLANCKALLLGTGTLGCNVARGLLMWGVRHLTLVDRGSVAFSNLVRQSLFTVEDATSRREKTEAAARALREMIPHVCVNPVTLAIPMPGHRTEPEEAEGVMRDIHRLSELIETHDVVFLLTDSREARWMPTVIAAACGTPVINVALGFDTFVVMRHGVVSPVSQSNVVGAEDTADPSSTPALGCYFCSDVIAPSDTVTMRALDQQCTVTRPGVSSIASAIAVEVLAELYQHPLGFRCPGYRAGSAGDQDGGKCRLGVIPQQIRGSVYFHEVSHLFGERNPFCTACAESLLAEYHTHGAEFLLQCVNSPNLIEEVCGVKALKQKWELEADAMEWSSNDES